SGTPASKRLFGGSGAPSSYTLLGPPESTMPLYPPVSSSSGRWVHGRISEYTPRSRMRRANSCGSCPPKSKTARLSVGSTRQPLAGPPQFLRLLEDLAFRLDRRGDDQLRLLELANVLGSHRAHARSNRADEVQRSVLGERGPEEDLLERPRDSHADA